ncbi:zinc finger protein 276 isoform X2 [Pseudophryne corroboree]|uniref:zinc finger protein 276 isoform X2 n=1 Tax=Pseudophryne corroboree TaxID=495146 RepID=UPI00308179D9
MKRDRRGQSTACHRKTSRSVPKEVVAALKPPPTLEPAAGIGRPLSTGYCRLCHGKFSSRSLRQAFGKVPVTCRSSEKQRRTDQVFFADFHQLVGVSVRQDPRLPQFVCKDCHTQFYKCRSVLRTFIQRVNISPTTPHSNMMGTHSPEGVTTGPCSDLITSSPECLHSLVSWTHSHAGGCSSVPSLQRVLSRQYCGIIQAVWGCGQGHDYVMETDSDCTTPDAQRDADPPKVPSGNGIHTVSTDTDILPLECSLPDTMDAATTSVPDIGRAGDPPARSSSPDQLLESAAPLCPEPDSVHASGRASPTCTDLGKTTGNELLSQETHCHRRRAASGRASPTSTDLRKAEGNELSDGDSQSRDDGEERGDLLSSDDSFEPYPEKSRIPLRRSTPRGGRKAQEPRERKKPGPKPGWKKIKREREELPTIYKCPYQGCTAVYRGADGMKKHIKEHHEEVRERPCPHPGCNKVFMIDRYLQRHVKLIHTEERNYICDQCGQAFKQRKHLSVHQMRHSGAKPLQCEVCGFQCRQRASLKYHMTKHKAEADLEFACDQCGKRFEKAHNLNVHMSMVHPLTQSPAKPPETEPDIPSGTMETVKPQQLHS